MKIYLATILLLICKSNSLFGQYTKLWDFYLESTGEGPIGTLIYENQYLYGVTKNGGLSSNGTIFKTKTDGSGFQKLFDFSGTDGRYPLGGLIAIDSFLYGTTSEGTGTSSSGNIFKIKNDGTEFSILHSFDNGNEGENSRDQLFFDGTYLYGVNSSGANSSSGTLYKIKPDGSDFAVLYAFSGSSGYKPNGPIISDGTYLYGTTSFGANNGAGSIYKILTSGSNFTKLLDFDTTTNNNTSTGGLILLGDSLYGLSYSGGSYGKGTLYKIKNDGSGYTNIYSFGDASGGAYPIGSLLLVNNVFWGTTYLGGSSDYGTIFKINIDGASSSYEDILSFTASDFYDVSRNIGALTSVDDSFYAIAESGGASDAGVILKLKEDGTNNSVIINFSGSGSESNPVGSLALNGTTLYGAAITGGANGKGRVYSESAVGSSQTQNIYDFGGTTDGSFPNGSLLYDSDFLYGMTHEGGTYNDGIIFKIDLSNYNTFTKLHDFEPPPPQGTEGRNPLGSLVCDPINLYGMTWQGGDNDLGTIFKIQKDGVENNYLTMHSFTGSPDGRNPHGTFVMDDSVLYGVTSAGGNYDDGTVFSIHRDGSNYTKLFDFSSQESGSNPIGSLIAINSYLYGMTQYGGDNNEGVIFKIKEDGSDFTKLFDFSNGFSGRYPSGELTFFNNNLYGMTEFGGAYDDGAIFKISTSDNNFTKLLDFSETENGKHPTGKLVIYNQDLFGSANSGGAFGGGTLFKINPEFLSVYENNASQQVAIFPNPCSNYITIGASSFADNLKPVKINLIDLAGQVVYDTLLVMNKQSNKYTIDISKLPAGLYFIKILTDKETFVQKLMIQ